MARFDAVVVGAGPNGLAAAVELTRSGRRVLVLEGAATVGGGTRTEELTLPGFLHDVCAAIHPLGVASPFFRSIGVGDWIHPEIPVTHPLDKGRSGVLYRSLDRTATALGPDGARYRRYVGGLVDHADDLVAEVLGPVRFTPRHPVTLGRFGLPGLLPASVVAAGLETKEARALLAGMAAHAIAPFTSPLTGAVSTLFAVAAHARGWPLVRGGSQRIAEEMARLIEAGGGSVQTGRVIRSNADLPATGTVLLDVMPPAALQLIGHRLDARSRRRLGRWSQGPGVFKVDWALDGPIPWADDASRRTATIHVGGTYEEVAAAEQAVHAGDHPERPFVIVAQQSLFDTTRVPADGETAWAYCHVPVGSNRDMTAAIEAQIERFAPGFRDRILARHTMGPADYQAHNPNYVGGDIAGGAYSIRRLLQPGRSRPYRLGEGVYLCSSATPPGAGVHGMCGYFAARAAITDAA